MTLKFINNKNYEVKQVFQKRQKGIKKIEIASAFFAFDTTIKEIFESCVKKKVKIDLIVGSSHYHLQPRFAYELDRFVSENKKLITVKCFRETKKNHIFHSKFYLFYGQSGNPNFSLFGSSNMTPSGFSRTYESNFFSDNREIFAMLKNEFQVIPTKKFDPTIYKAQKRSAPEVDESDESEEELYSPHEYQRKIIDTVGKKFVKNDRGHMILPCGTGKTLISLWVKERMEFEKVLVFLPTLALLNQTLTVWNEQKIHDYDIMCVCSDKSVGLSIDETSSSVNELTRIVKRTDITTDPKKIKKFLRKKKFVIFSTYHSSKQILTACGADSKFDCIFYDESHNIATVKSKQSKENLTQSHHIDSSKKLFMTATPKIINPALLGGLEKSNFAIYSMDDEKIFGPEFYNMTFHEAISNDDIPVLPYKILLATAAKEKGTKEDRKQIALMKTLAENVPQVTRKPRFNVNKIISYHSDVNNAKQFIAGNFEKIKENHLKQDLYSGHINGYDNAEKRKDILDKLKDSEKGIITNCRCLSEGINSPSVDAVFFSDPKTNIIDIVQATGRAMRKDPNNPKKKTAYVIIPISDESSLANVAQILQGLALTDKKAEALISAITKAHRKNGGYPPPPPWIDPVPELPDGEMKKLWENLSIKVAQNNIKLGSQGRTLPSGAGGNGFFKRLTHNDVRGKSSPGQYSIDRDYVKYFPEASQEIKTGTGFEIIFNIIFVNEKGTEEKVNGVRLLYYSAKKHKRWTEKDYRFTFRNKKFFERRGMEEEDILQFEPNDDEDFPMKITLIKKDSDEAKRSPYRDARRAGEL